MTIYEKIKSTTDPDSMAKVMYDIYEDDDTDICLYCQEPSGCWCVNEYCINAMKRVLTELEYNNA